MAEGVGVKNVLKGTGKGLLNLTPYEEVKTLFRTDVDSSEKIRAGFLTVSKLAGLFGMYKSLKTPSNPKSQTLENFQSRKWYLNQEKMIPENIDQNLPIKEKALKAFNKRNEIRTIARESMADADEASSLNIKEPNMKLREIVKKYYDNGYVGDNLWEKIYNSATKSRATVNIKMQLKQIYHILFFSSVSKER